VTAVSSAVLGESLPAASDLLERARAVVGPQLSSVVGRLSPELRAAVDHHLAGGGKYVRAALALISAAATGGDDAAAIPGAVAIELVHNFSLVHDDIIDGDLERRHRSTVWAEYGVGHAIIAGDALVTLAFQVLLAEPTPERVRAAARLGEATQAMISGQAEDMASERRATFGVDECLHMEAGKTGALLSCAACFGAILSGAPETQVEALADFGRHLGVAFQAVDDVLGIWGEPVVTGKPVGNDLRMHKKTLPVALGLERAPAAAGELPRLLQAGDLEDADVTRAAGLLEQCGARRTTMAIGESHLRAALRALDRVPLAGGSRAELESIARFVTARDR
jgi:geranylgeranyl diphosphate synthase, type I